MVTYEIKGLVRKSNGKSFVHYIPFRMIVYQFFYKRIYSTISVYLLDDVLIIQICFESKDFQFFVSELKEKVFESARQKLPAGIVTLSKV